MNHIYRLVWSCVAQAWVAVAEIARGHGRGRPGPSRGRRAVAVALLLPAAGSGLSALAQTVTLAPGQQATAYVAPNGTTVVDIANPNAAGVSHNRFLRYDVGPRGLVLNNTTAQGAMVYPSQLAGAVLANPNASRAAGIIVNEVMATRRSVLAGYTEVAGQRADVVVANPYGITCTGCGFINTDRVTLATGLPRWAGNGGLQGLAVTGGDILVNGKGLDASGQKILDLVTRSVRLDGAVHARDLSLSAGNGTWNYRTRKAGAAASAAAVPAYAIDSSVLGGMYANSIRLVATEAGVGVRMLGEAAASRADFTLSATGRVDLRNRVSAARDVLVAGNASDAAAIALAGASLTARRGLSIEASQGGVAATRSVMVAGEDLALSAGRDLALAGTVRADGSVALAAGRDLRAAATLRAGDAATLSAGRDLRVAGAARAAATLAVSAGRDLGVAAAMQASGAVALSAAGDLAIAAGEGQGVQSTAGNVFLAAGAEMRNAGLVSADAGDLALRAGTRVDNTGGMHAGGGIAVTGDAAAAPMLRNQGSLVAGQELAIQVAALENSGELQGARVAVRADSLANSGRVLATQGAVDLAVAGGVDNSGLLQAAGVLALSAGDVANSGTLVATEDVQLAVGALQNSAVLQGARVALRADSFANSGQLLATHDASDLEVAGTVDNSGLLQTAGDLALSARGVVNSGTLLVIGDAQLEVAALDNRAGGRLLVDGALDLQADTLVNATGAHIQSRTAATVTVDTADNQGVVLLAGTTGGTAALSASSRFSNAGVVHAAGSLRLAGGALENAGTVGAGQDLQVEVTSLDNTSAGDLSAGRALQLEAASLQNAGSMTAAGQAGVVAQALANHATGTIRGGTGLAIEFGGAEFHNVGRLQAGTGQAAERAALAIYGPGGLLRNSGDLQGGTLGLTAASLANSGSITAGAGGAVLTALTGDFSNATDAVASLGGTGSGDSMVSAARVVNDGILQSQDGMVLAVGSGGLHSAGQLRSGGLLAIEGRAGSYQATLDGATSAGATLRVTGDAGSGLALVNGAEVQAGAVDIQTGALDLGARTILASRGNLALDVGRLVLAETVEDVEGTPTVRTGRILGALDGAATTSVDVRVHSAFDNAGLVFSGTDLDVAAPNLHVTANGALSALGNLHLAANAGALDLAASTPDPAAGNLLNEGLLYAGGGLSARVNGTLTNKATLQGGTQVDLLANTLVNHRDIDSLGDLRIVATKLRNEVEGGDRRVFRSTWNPATASWAQTGGQWDDGGSGGNLDKAQNWITYFTEHLEYLPGEEPQYWPRITAQDHAQLFFNAGTNLGGLIQAQQSVLLQGFVAQAGGTPLVAGLQDDGGRQPVAPTSMAMATFENNSLAQVVLSYRRLHTQTRKEAGPAGGVVQEDWNWCTVSSDAVCLQGYVVPVNQVTGVHAVNPVGYAGARIYTAQLSGGGFTFFNEGSTTPAAFVPATVQTTTALTLPGHYAPAPVAVQPSGLPGAGTRTGWTPVDPAIQAITVTGSDGRPLQGGLAFGGIRLSLPAGANGLFVTAPDPAAGYLVEANPLYGVGAAVAGSEYLRDRLGFDADDLLMRLGDGSYEAWMVQQQLLAQTGSMLLKGNGSLAAQMKALWENAAEAAKALDLEWGSPLSAQQQAALRRDIVWMVATEVGGRSVLVPVVYLSQATKDGIRKGAIVAAEGGTLTVDGLANSGTITGVDMRNEATQGGAGRRGLAAGPGSAIGLPAQFRDQSFEIVKAYLLSESKDQTVRFGDVNAWLAANKSNPEALGAVLPHAFQRFMSLATGDGVMSPNDKAFVTYVGEYAKAQRIAAVNDALQDYAKWKSGPKLGQNGQRALLTSLFDLGESPPDEIKKLAQTGISWSGNDEARRIGALLGASVGATTAGAAAGGTSAALMNQIFPYLGRAMATAAGSSITALSTASGPFAIVTAAAAIAGQAIAKLVSDANFEKDLLKLKAEYEGVPGGDVGYWLKKEGGAEQIMLSMAKMMAN